MNNLLILGAGQHGHVAKEIAESMKCFEKIEFLDDFAECAIGKLDDYERFINSSQKFFVAIGNNVRRMQWIERLENSGCDITRLVSNQAMISPSVVIGVGSIVECGAIVNTATTISKGCILSI